MIPDLKLEVIEDLETWRALRPEWNRLADSLSDVSVFSRWEWQFAWWRRFWPEADLHIMAFRDRDGALRAVFPFYIQEERVRGLVRFDIGRLIGSGWSDYLNILCGDDGIARLAGDALRKSRPNLLFDLSMLPADGHRIEQLLGGGPLAVRRVETCPFMILPGHERDFWAGLGRRTRKNIRRGLSRLGEEHQARLRVTRDYRGIREALERIYALQAGWFGETKATAAGRRNYLGVLIDSARDLCPEGMPVAVSLENERGVIAAQYCLDYKGRRHFVIGGLDAAYRRHDPGKCVIALSIADAIERGLKEYDFLNGDEDYKRLFADRQRYCINAAAGFSRAVFRAHRALNALNYPKPSR
jgi:CelD/BcsL family acetyltransferase involved in cellulose biosynthesis